MVDVLVVVVAITLAGGLWVWLLSWIACDLTVKGSHGRYVARSVRRFSQWAAAGYYLLFTPYKFYQHDWFWGSVYLLATYICFKSILDFYNSDEDDFWKRGKKKLKKALRRARENLRVRKPVAAGGFA